MTLRMAACVGDKTGAYSVVVKRRGGRDHLGDPSVDGRIILNWIFKMWDGCMYWI